MNIKFENIYCTYKYENSNHDIGASRLVLSKEDFNLFLEDSNNRVEYDKDIIENWLKSEDEHEFETYNTDLQILIFNWILNHKKDVSVEYYAEHYFWFIHDCFHAKHDVTAGSIYVYAFIEEKRNFQAIDFINENLYHSFQPQDMLMMGDVYDEMKKRWGYQFDIKKACKKMGFKKKEIKQYLYEYL